MENIRAWTEEDEAIIATNTDASECKRGAVELGYWRDDYVQYFSRRADRRAPEINRGYFARVRAIEILVHQFLERCGSKCQIISLGCGYDTLYWRLRDSTRAVGNYVELDFPTVTAKKCQIIKRNKALMEKITNEDGEVVIRSGDLHADNYHLVGCDLRCVAEVRRKLSSAGALGGAGAAGAGAAGEGRGEALPTLVLAECVLVYLRPEPAAALLAALCAALPTSMVIVYEQCNLDDKFGEVMVRNLESRGCLLAGAAGARGGPGAAAARLRAAGWARAAAWDMRAVWAALPAAERARADRLEPLDEHELLQQLHAHYALGVAARGALLADLELDDPAALLSGPAS
ncbi:hypothetical protein JYU34_003962 [Plutella xylostella]|uniref:Leucine carboxyl methyltransferase 1 n=1 Tax=Plutella xylostella TaxID=51655 RepID=A0ABQ7R1F4_PLUXY|nr:leucine carboxyl methyltransferase 1 [Plutella xylostella]KAG7311096.1 hypothetical protein JYU34_003962 [Plutella xylostella]